VFVDTAQVMANMEAVVTVKLKKEGGVT